MFKTKSIIVALCTIFIFNNMQAQSLEAGLKGGINFSKFSYKNNPSGYSLNNKKGLTVGIFLKYNFNKIVSIQSEALFSMKGMKLESNVIKGTKNTVTTNSVTYKTNYLQIPVLLNFSFPVNQKIGIKFFAGPSIGFLLSGKKEGTESGENIQSTNIKKQFNSPDLGLVFGAGPELKIGAAKLIIEARYNFGLKNINNNFTKGKVTNRGLTILAGFSFPLN